MNEFMNNLLNKPGVPGKLLDKLRIAQLLDKMHLDKLDTKKALLIMAVCLITVTYLDLAFLARLQFAALKAINPKIIKMQKDLDALDKGLLIMQDVKTKQRQDLSKSRKIISEEQIDYILQDLSNMAKKASVNITQMKPSRQASAKQAKNQPQPRLIPLLISLDLLCDYHNFGKFINGLENAEILFEVESFRITRQEDNYFKQRVNLVLRTYVKK